MSLFSYVPEDRFNALAQGQNLPEVSAGVALLADISGFTPLTEALGQELGARKGAEELTYHLNLVYSALISQVNIYGGSVNNFSGDAITCWFSAENKDLGQVTGRAITAALALQKEIQKLATIRTPSGTELTLALKVAVASGTARRFVVGNPEYQLIDVLTGSLLDQLARAEQLAQKGEVAVTSATVALLETSLAIGEWRKDPESDQSFALVNGLTPLAEPSPLIALAETPVKPEKLKPWLLAPIYERLQAGLNPFLTELRPATALFSRFGGLDYDNDTSAGGKLNEFVGWVQRVAAEFGGNVLQITFGDKGSYLYIAFGAPVAHQNDAERAVRAGLSLVTPPGEFGWLTRIQIGISQGTMRVGTYGSPNRHTYGVLGDEVNLAARLMQAAKPGEILVSSRVKKAIEARSKGSFEWENLPPLKVKGKTEAISVFRVTGESHQHRVGLTEPRYSLPLVGRETEMATVEGKLRLVKEGQGQIVAISGEAGIGKSRLLAEISDMLREHGFEILAGECQSYGTNSSYSVWRPVFRSLFRLNPEQSLEEQTNALETRLNELNPQFRRRLPLLSGALNLPFPENDFTGSLDAKARKEAAESFLIDIIKAYIGLMNGTALTLVLEDCHWLDPLSQDLLSLIGKVAGNLPVLILLTYRPPETVQIQPPVISTFAHSTVIELKSLDEGRVENLIANKLGQVPGSDAIQNLKTTIHKRTEGNPFYIEELLNYLQDRGINFKDETAVAKAELPESLHSLVLSRIDRLEEGEKATLKVASIVGRVFKANWLAGVYPALGAPVQIQRYLAKLDKLEITPVSKPAPDLEYLFKHAIIQEVAYESQSETSREELHERAGRYIEEEFGDQTAQWVDMLTYHYGRSSNRAKQREYYTKAGDAAKAKFANSVAIDYYQKLLALVPEEEVTERIELELKLTEVLFVVGRWQETEQICRRTLAVARELPSPNIWQARLERVLALLLFNKGDYSEAQLFLESCSRIYAELDDKDALSKILLILGAISSRQGNYTQSLEYYEQGLALAKEAGNKSLVADITSNIAIIYARQEQFEMALNYFKQALQIAEENNYIRPIIDALSNLGILYTSQYKFEQGIECLTRGLALALEVGESSKQAVATGNLGDIFRSLGEYDKALDYLHRYLTMSEELGNKHFVSAALGNLGRTYKALGNYEQAEKYLNRAINLDRQLNHKFNLSVDLASQAELYLEQGRLAEAITASQEGHAIAVEINRPSIIFDTEVLSAKIGALSDKPGAVNQLQDLLGRYEEPAMVARIHYELFKLNGSHAEKEKARDLYKILVEKAPDITHKSRLAELSEGLT